MFSYSNLAQPKVLEIEKVADSIAGGTLKLMRSFLAEDIDEDDISLVPELLPNCSRKEPVLLSGGTAIEKESISKPGNEEKDH